MQAPPGGSLVLIFKDALSPPSGGSVQLQFTSTSPAPTGVGGVYSAAFGQPSVGLRSTFIKPTGWVDSAFPRFPLKTPTVAIDSLRISPLGWVDGVVSSPTYVRWRRYLLPASMAPGENVPPPFSVRLAGGYQPAPGSNIILNFAEPLVPPPGGAMVLEFGASGYTRVLGATLGNTSAYGTPSLSIAAQLRPVGIGPLAVFGTPKVEGNVRYVSLSAGIAPPTGQVPSPTIAKKASALLPGGIATPGFGTAKVYNYVQYVRPVGALTYLSGTTIIYNWRTIARPGGIAATAYGVASVTYARRTILGLGANTAQYGTPAIANRNRTVAPPSIYTAFPSAHMVGGRRYISPVGFLATRFGTRIIPEIQAAYPQGFVGAFGLPSLENRWSVIKPPGFAPTPQPADAWGTARVYNLRQFITLYYDPDSELNPPGWSPWTAIANRNRLVTTFGQQSSRVGEPNIFNNARPLLPSGIAAPANAESYKAGMVAYRIRSCRIEGLEPPYMSGWSRIHNDARVLAPAGFVASLFGTAKLANTRRYFDRIGNFVSMVFGYPMVAPRVRTLEFEGRYTIAPPTLPLPEVKLHTRYVEVPGTEMTRIGSPSLSIHWTLITPRWTLQNLYGEPTVRNVTPELRTKGRVSEEFGTPFVRLQWRPIQTIETLTQVFGRPTIADRDRRMTVTGFRAGVMGDKLVVTKTGSPPYSDQFVWLDYTADGDANLRDGNGIPPPENQVGRPVMNQQVLYVRQDGAATAFGNAKVTANSIRVEPGYQELTVGSPMVALKIRALVVGEFDDVYEPSKPRLSPNTIWAMTEAPQQAKVNHPTVLPLHPIDGYGRAPGAIFGTTVVTLQYRIMNARSFSALSMGIPGVQNKRHYINLTGWTSMRFGWHTFPGPQTVEQYEPSNSMVFGSPTVKRPPYVGPQTITVPGLSAQAFGATWVEFFNRQVKPVGLASQAMGTRLASDTPYMWQGLRVGPLLPTIPAGRDNALYGVPWVSFRVRELLTSGFDAFLCEYDLEAFEQRMRVTRRAGSGTPTIPARTLAPVGFAAFAQAVPDVKPGVHYIRPDGNADQFRKGAF